MDFQTSIQEVLRSNEKNIGDLISQDLSLFLLAYLCADRPELEAQTEMIFHQSYRSTCQALEELFVQMLSEGRLQLSEEEVIAIKQEIQLFVHHLIDKKKQELAEKIHWARRHL